MIRRMLTHTLLSALAIAAASAAFQALVLGA